MTQSEWIELAVALVCALGASVLAAVETALSVMTKSRAERMVEQGERGAERIRLIMADPAPSINALMFARATLETSSIVVASIVMFTQFSADWERALVTIAIMLTISFILWGVAPRTLGRQNPERTLSIFARLVGALTTVLGPVAQLMILLGNALTPGRGYADGPFATEAELRDMVDMAEAHDVIEAGESKMIHSVFELGDTIVKEVMVPRTDMVFITKDKTLRQLLSLALRSGFSRIPVIGEDLDDVLGVVYLKDVSKRVYDFPDAERKENVASLMRPAAFCPDSKPVSELLHNMQFSHSHLVIVVDEFGGTAGLATIEDILEEIVGEIEDEHDEEAPDPVTRLSDGAVEIDGAMTIRDLNRAMDWSLPDDEANTVAGLIIHEAQMIPEQGQMFAFHGFRFKVLERVENRLTRLKVRKL